MARGTKKDKSQQDPVLNIEKIVSLENNINEKTNFEIIDDIKKIVNNGEDAVKEELLSLIGYISIKCFKELNYIDDITSIEYKNASTSAKNIISIFNTMNAISKGIFRDEDFEYEE